jgi:hypothetical protein
MLPRGIVVGQIYCQADFYRDNNGQPMAKYLLVLAASLGGDVIFRLLTSRAHGRPSKPACYHGLPYASFYLGILGGELGKESWLDLRATPDYEGGIFAKNLQTGALRYVTVLDAASLPPILECTAAADDTTRQQEQALRHQKTLL